MKTENDFRRAIGRADPGFERAIDHTLLRLNEQEEIKKKNKIPVALAVTAALLLLITAAAAMESLRSGLLDWLPGIRDDPDAPIVTERPKTDVQVKTDYASFRLREAVTDGYGVYATVVCTPSRPGTLILDADMIPSQDPASDLGVIPDSPGETILQWAKAHGYDSLGRALIFSPRTQYEWEYDGFYSGITRKISLEEDGSSVFLISGVYQGEKHTYQLDCFAGPWMEPYWNEGHKETSWGPQEQGAFSFSLQEPAVGDTQVLAEYAAPEEQPDGAIRIKGTRLIRTALAEYYEVIYEMGGEGQYTRWNPPMFITSDMGLPEIKAHGTLRDAQGEGSEQYRYICACQLPQTIPDTLSLTEILWTGAADSEQTAVILNRIP
ncbi:MAG: hypothetical protein IJ157_08715 [Clostridia bacterium]|nr:hypothetical protein [Clostridia bacterium]